MNLNITSYEELEELIHRASYRSKVFSIVRKEVSARGHWRGLPRGEQAGQKRYYKPNKMRTPKKLIH